MSAARKEVERAVRASKLFFGLPETTLAMIIDHSSLVHAPPESAIWTQGQQTEFFALIRKGIVCMSQGPVGSRVSVELLGAGDSTGMLATLGGIPHPLNAVSLAETTFVRVPSALWREVAHAEPRLMEHAMVEVVPRMLGGYRFMATMSQGEIGGRLATVVLRMAELTARTHGPDAPLLVTRRILAGITGTTVETAIRVTSRWQKLGWIAARHGRMWVVDADAIRALAPLT